MEVYGRKQDKQVGFGHTAIMTNLIQTFSSYAIDRRPVADVSYAGISTANMSAVLQSLYGSGFRRFVVPAFSSGTLWDSSQECEEWGGAVADFLDSCSHPVSVLVRHGLESHTDPSSGLIESSFLNDQVIHVFNTGVLGFVDSFTGYGAEPYLDCSHPQLRQLLGMFDNAHLWRDSTQDPYVSISGSCDLPTWYQAPTEVIDGLSPYSGWASEPMRRTVETVAVIPSDMANSNNFASCASWGFVPCLRLSPSDAGVSYTTVVDAYMSAETRVKTTFARSRKLVVSSSAARRSCGEVPASPAFFNSDAMSIRQVICPANIDCSHSEYPSKDALHISSASCTTTPLYYDPLWEVGADVSVSGKLSVSSMFGSTGATKAAEAALEIIAEELSAHPDPSYVGELASVIVFSNWGRGGNVDGVVDAAYEECRLTTHAGDAVLPIVPHRPIIDGRDTLYAAYGIDACSLWMKEFIIRFESYRQRLAVFAGCSIPAPWMIMIKSKLQVDVHNAVRNPTSVDGVMYYGNWAEQRSDSRWATEQLVDFGNGYITAQQFSLVGDEYICTGYRPDGTKSQDFTASNLQSDASAIDPIGNRAFTKWYNDIARASAAGALSKSIGVMARNHFAGCAVSCPDLVPNNSGSIVCREIGKPTFCQVQEKPFSSPAVSSTPSVFMAHLGMIAQGHPTLPPVPAGARFLAKCDADGSQRVDWYVNSPIGDCSWEYGDQNVAFSFISSSSSSSSDVYEPIYQKSSTALTLDAPVTQESIVSTAHPMRDAYLASSSVSSEAP